MPSLSLASAILAMLAVPHGSTQVAANPESTLERLMYCIKNYAGSKVSSSGISLRRGYEIREEESGSASKHLTFVMTRSMSEQTWDYDWSFEVKSTFKVDWGNVEAIRFQKSDPLAIRPKPNAIYVVFKEPLKPTVEVPEDATKINFYDLNPDAKLIREYRDKQIRKMREEEEAATAGFEIVFPKSEQLDATVEAFKTFLADAKVTVDVREKQSG